jgi:hypothetical protein
VSLANAREAARIARAQARAGIDPIDARKAARKMAVAMRERAKSFDECAAAYIEAKGGEWDNAKHNVHRVPLSEPALRILRSQPRETEFVFTGRNGCQLSNMAMTLVVRRLAVDAVPHGLARATFTPCGSTGAALPDRAGLRRRLRRLEQLDRIPGGILHQRLPSSGACSDLVAKPHTGLLQGDDVVVEAVGLDHDAIPATGLRLAPVGHRLRTPSGTFRRTQHELEPFSLEESEIRTRSNADAERQMTGVEPDRFIDVVHDVAKHECVQLHHHPREC